MWYSFLTLLCLPFPRRKATARLRRGSRPLTFERLESRDVPAYLVTDLGVSPGFVGGTAAAINNVGQVVGYELTADYVDHAFIWQNGVMTDLGTLGGRDSMALGINDLGQVVGVSESSQTDANGYPLQHAFVWQNGVMTDLDPNGISSQANGINNIGQIVGTAAVNDENVHAMLWQNGTKTDLGTLPGDSNSSAADINNLGQIVGLSNESAPFLWQNGTMTALELAGNSASVAAINDAGQVVGSTTVFGFVDLTTATRWQDGYAYDLGVGYMSSATDINSSGQIVGEGDYPFLAQNGVVTDLYYQVANGGSYISVQSINDAGQIAGSSNGHAVLLNPVASLPTFGINNVSVTEGNSGTANAVFTVSLSSPARWPVTVQYATADDTATAGSDYQAAFGTLTFAPGETSKTIAVAVNGDRLAEPDETFTLNLSSAINANVANNQGVGSILDDEPRIRISDVTKSEGKQGQTTLFTFTVTLSAAYDQSVTMSFRTLDGTARVRDHDYVSQTATLTFNPGETTKTITIVVKGDNKKEANETFYLDLFGNSSNSLFTKNRGIGTILNDD